MIKTSLTHTRQIDAAGVVASGLVLAGAWFALAEPLRSSWAQADARESELGVLQAEAAAAEADAEALASRLEESERLAARASLQARSVSELNARVAEIVNAAEDHGLEPRTVRPGSPQRDGAAMRVGIDLAGAGRFTELTEFLAHLFAEHRDVTLTHIDLARDRGGTTFDLDLVWWAAGSAGERGTP